jgi:hypothetical protein
VQLTFFSRTQKTASPARTHPRPRPPTRASLLAELSASLSQATEKLRSLGGRSFSSDIKDCFSIIIACRAFCFSGGSAAARQPHATAPLHPDVATEGSFALLSPDAPCRENHHGPPLPIGAKCSHEVTLSSHHMHSYKRKYRVHRIVGVADSAQVLVAQALLPVCSRSGMCPRSPRHRPDSKPTPAR